jgi:adenylate kinase
MRYHTGKRAVVVYGPPGSGKGTQAELLARLFGFIHLDTGRYIESVVHAPGASKDPVLKREGKNFDTGKLCTPSWVLKVMSDAATHIAESGSSVVFSGAPRTTPEAFGLQYAEGETNVPKVGGLVAVLTKLYGKKNITFVKLVVREASSRKRNSQRLICSVCGTPALAHAHPKYCSFCGGPMRRRTLDAPSVITVRLKQYRDRTYPIFAVMKKHGYRVIEVNGEPAPCKVHEAVKKAVGL